MPTSEPRKLASGADSTTWTVGELANRTGLTVRTLHHYDEIGLLSPSQRSEAGYRRYTAADVARLQHIQSLRALGFALGEIRDCLTRPDFAPLRTVRLHLAALRQRIAQEHELCDRLEALAARLVGRGPDEISAEEFLLVLEGMMKIEPIDTLVGLRAVMEAPEAERERLYRERVLEPLRPGLEWLLRHRLSNLPASDGGDQLLHLVRVQGTYTPDLDPAVVLEALDTLERAGALQACLDAIRRGETLLRPEEHGVRFERIQLALVLSGPDKLASNRGYAGSSNCDLMGPGTGWITVNVWPNEFNLPRLPSCAAHQFHRLVRGSYMTGGDAEGTKGEEPNGVAGDALARGLVSEGLAAAFAGELCGHDLVGPWSTALTDEEVETWRPRFGAALKATDPEEFRGYMHGSKEQGIPHNAGYTIGYRLARTYLERTGRNIEEATYAPWQEIVARSGYF